MKFINFLEKCKVRKIVPGLLGISMVAANVWAADTVPSMPNPSIVKVVGTQLKVMHRRSGSNGLKADAGELGQYDTGDGENFVIKGVCWSVAQRWPTETYPSGGPFENDNRSRMWEMAEFDFPRIKEAGFNTIRLYADLGLAEDDVLKYDADEGATGLPDSGDDAENDWLHNMPKVGNQDSSETSGNITDDAKAVLDAAYKNGLKVIVTVGLAGDLDLAKEIVKAYKGHPAVLMWLIGNEFNYSTQHQEDEPPEFMWGFDYFYSSYDTSESAIHAAQTIADAIKTLDSNHPVAVCLGEPGYAGEKYKLGTDPAEYWYGVQTGVSTFQSGYAGMKTVINYLETQGDVDIIAMNMYRGRSFKNLYQEWTDTNLVDCDLPIFISEYGVDTWHYLDPNIVSNAPYKEFKDAFAQQEGTGWQWGDLHAHLSSQDSNNIMLGGCVFEWVDEFWKLKGSDPLALDTDPGYPVNLGDPPSPDLYPDGVMQEEHWGINAQDNTTANPVSFYGDFGLIGESESGNQSWDIFTWGLPVEGEGYGKLNAQADYITDTENLHGLGDGIRQTNIPYHEYYYTGSDSIPEGHRCLFMNVFTGEDYGAGWGIYRTGKTVDLSAYDGGEIKFWIKIHNANDAAIGSEEDEIYFKFEDDRGPGHAIYVWLDGDQDRDSGTAAIDYFPSGQQGGFNPSLSTWQELTMPISALVDGHTYADDKGNDDLKANLNLSRVKMAFSVTSAKVESAYDRYVWIDDVRWYMSEEVANNRNPEPAVATYRENYNTLAENKTVFHVLAHSQTYNATPDPDQQYLAGIQKNGTTVIGDFYWDDPRHLALNDVLAVAFDADTGEVVTWASLSSFSAIDAFIGDFDDPGDHYVLSFVVNDSCSFVDDSTLLDNIGSEDYDNVGEGESWAFVTHIRDGVCINKVEDNSSTTKISQVVLPVAMDEDGDGVLSLVDIDRDGDGLPDEAEVRYQTNIHDTDTDDDGINDSSEIGNGTNPRNPDSQDLDDDDTNTRTADLVDFTRSLVFSNGENERYVLIENEGGEYLDYKVDVTGGSGWLTVKARDPQADGAWAAVSQSTYGLYDDIDNPVLQVTIDRSSMTSSTTYTATITITSQDDNGNAAGTKTINVSVPYTNKLVVWPKERRYFNADPLSATPADQDTIIHLTNEGGGSISWTASETASWLSLSPTNGSGLDVEEVAEITATIDWDDIDGANVGTIIEIDAGTDGTQYVFIEARQWPKIGLNTLLSEVDASFVGVQKDDFRESQAIATGDVNGDGYEDVLIGALQFYNTNDNGRAYLIFGKPDGWRNDQSIQEAVKFFGRADNGDRYIGSGVALADVDGDGLDDIIIGDKAGSAYMEENDNASGRLFVFFGKEDGWDRLYEVSRQADAMVMAEDARNTGFADKVTAGDFDFDGKDDLLITSANLVNDGGNFVLYAFVLYGRDKDDWISPPELGNNDSWQTNRLNLYGNYARLGRYSGSQLNMRSRSATVGDINGDGKDDAIVSTWLQGSGTSSSEKVYILYGGTSEWALNENQNMDSAADIVIDVSSLGHNPQDTNYPYTYLEGQGTFIHIDAGGDVDGDGKDDLLIGSGDGNVGSYAQEVFLIEGSTLSGGSSFTIPTHEDASFLTRTGGYEVANVHIAKDLNGDGYDEVAYSDSVVADYFIDPDDGSVVPGTSQYGSTYIFFGKSSGWTTNTAIANANVSYVEEVDDEAGDTFAENPIGSGDLDGNGINDLIIVKGYADQGNIDSGQAYVVMGGGFGVSTDALYFGDRGDTTESETVYVNFTGISDGDDTTYDVSWTASATVDWITSLSPSSGTIDPDNSSYDDPDALAVTVDRTDLADGLHTGYVIVSNAGQSKYLPVHLHVGYEENKPLLKVVLRDNVLYPPYGNDDHYFVGAEDGAAYIILSNEGSGKIDYTITDDGQSWIGLIYPSSGSITTEEDVIALNVNNSWTSAPFDLTTGTVTINFEHANTGVTGSKQVFITMAPSETPWRTNQNGTQYGPITASGKQIGYFFTPQEDGYVSSLAGYLKDDTGGAKWFGLWDVTNTTMLSWTQVSHVPFAPVWNDSRVDAYSYVPVTKNNQYAVIIWSTNHSIYYYTQVNNTLPQTYDNIKIDGGCWRNSSSGCPNPSTDLNTGYVYGEVDIKFTTLKPEAIKQTPWQDNVNGTLNTGQNWDGTIGHYFKPLVDGYITHFHGNSSGTRKVTLWKKSDKSVLASVNVTSSNDWESVKLDAPIKLTAGTEYVIGMYWNGSGNVKWTGISTLPQTYLDIQITGANARMGDAFPDQYTTYFSELYGVDMTFVPEY